MSFRKISSIYSMLRQGEWTEFFNSVMAALRLNRRISRGESRFFLAPPWNDLPHENEPGPTRLRMETVSDPAIVPELIRCMAGSDDYDYMTPDEISERFRDNLRRGGVVFVAKTESGDLAGFFWITTGLYTVPCGRRKIVLDLPDDLVVIEFIFVKREFRRQSVYSTSCREIRREKPDCRFACIVDSYNEPSMKAHLRLGFRRAGEILYLNFFGFLCASFRFGRSRKRFFVPTRHPPYRHLNARKV